MPLFIPTGPKNKRNSPPGKTIHGTRVASVRGRHLGYDYETHGACKKSYAHATRESVTIYHAD